MTASNISRGISVGLVIAMVTALVPVATVAAEPAASDPMQIVRGAKAWAENCGRCHNLRDPKDLVDVEWDVTLSHMRMRAGLPGQMARDIAAFLKASND